MNTRLALALAAFAVWTAITVIGGNMTTGGDKTLLQAVTGGIGWTWVIASGFILSVVLWRGWTDVGLNRAAQAKDWRLAWLPMVYSAGGFGVAAFLGLPPVPVLLLILVNGLFVGFSEELMFRGVMLQAFRHIVPVWPAVLLTSLAFGAVHSLNVFVTGGLTGALIQSAAAFLSGIVFIALRLRTGSLWPPVILHALWDFATFTLGAAGHAAATDSGLADGATVPPSGSLALIVPVLLVLPNALCGLWLMRNIGQTHRNPES
jgi:membrane protease YdiL (CAAX protease family)